MFNRVEVKVLPPGRRWAAQLQLWIDGEDVVADAVGAGGRGPLADEALPASGHGSLWATGEGRRVVLGEPECTGGCCGFLSAFVQRHGGIVEWSDWQMPRDEPRLPDFHFDADQYDAAMARSSADRWQQVSPE
ncbi:hypothetical protein EH183_40900 [Streptomyces sp. CB01881]|uniref:hypothetical protein n=1 Tax=Streptomyces sp. CB01881 TaxID=2078691 RepID=UPI0011DF24BD|nr:hypothetical protein [Streptomyces sp. CB01881]TYC68196.1 hypothetical protein EH183_40900 [Streptomyces sp. CB01881]